MLVFFFKKNIKLKEINRKDRSLCKDIYIYIDIEREYPFGYRCQRLRFDLFIFYFFFRAFHVIMHCSVGPMHCSVGPVYCSWDPQILYSGKKNFKTGSHNTIHIFKNYFATVFLVFNFQQNKLYPNRPVVSFWEQLI